MPMIPDRRTPQGKGPEVAKMLEAEKAEKAAGSEEHRALGGKEPPAEQGTEPADSDPQAAHRDHPTSLLTSPISELGNFREGRPMGSLKSPHQGPKHLGLGASLRS